MVVVWSNEHSIWWGFRFGSARLLPLIVHEDGEKLEFGGAEVGEVWEWMNLSVRSIHAILWCDCVGRGRASIISDDDVLCGMAGQVMT